MDYPYDLGRFSRKVTTDDPTAQLWFDRGLNWIYGFHHKEASCEIELFLAPQQGCLPDKNNPER